MIRVRLSYRMVPTESIRSRHLEVIQGLLEIDPPWGLKGKPLEDIPEVPEVADEDITAQGFLGIIGEGITSSMIYYFRHSEGLVDSKSEDDLAIIKIDPDKADYPYFLREILPRYIEIYRPYNVHVSDSATHDGDIDEMRELYMARAGEDIFGRNGLYRIEYACYWDDEFCRRAFGMESDDIIKKLSGKYPIVTKILDGVYFVVSFEVMSREETIKHDKDIRELIAGELH